MLLGAAVLVTALLGAAGMALLRWRRLRRPVIVKGTNAVLTQVDVTSTLDALDESGCELPTRGTHQGASRWKAQDVIEMSAPLILGSP